MATLKRRGVEVESVWGHIKEDRQFRRFLLRGLAKVQTEWGLLSVAHNLLKQATLAHEERGVTRLNWGIRLGRPCGRFLRRPLFHPCC